MGLALRRYGRAYAACLRMSLNQAMIYPMSFVSQVAGHLVAIGLSVFFFAVIYLGGATSVAGWSLPQVLLLLATNNLISWLDAFFFGSNLGRIPNLVRTGALDYYLLKPLSPRFLLSVQRANITAVLSLAAQAPLFAYALGALELAPGAAQVGLYVVLVLAGAVMRHSLGFAAAALSLWWTDSSSLQIMIGEVLDLAGYPADIYRRGIRLVLTYIVPVAVIANFPAQALQGLLAPAWVGVAVGLAALLFAASGWVWRFSVKRYTGASG